MNACKFKQVLTVLPRLIIILDYRLKTKRKTIIEKAYESISYVINIFRLAKIQDS